MNVGETLRDARHSARMTQRQLAARAGVPQSTVARVERGQLMPRVDTFDMLLRAAELRVSAEPLPGSGVDRSQIRRILRMTPRERVLAAADEANGLAALLVAAGRR